MSIAMGRGEGVLVQKPENCVAEENSSDAPSTSTSQFHVLAVDDSLIDRKVIEKLLKTSAYKVTTVDSGTRALEYLGLDKDQNSDNLGNIKVNMIITDYCMPGMTGYDLLKRVKESSIWREIPVVIMSSENVMARIDRCLEEGAEEFLLKPVKLADVKRLKSHIVKGLSKIHNQGSPTPPPPSLKRKSMSEDNDNTPLPSQSSERRPRVGELSVA